MSFWGKWASIPTKKSENKTVCVFFQGASDGNARIRRNIAQKQKNNEKLDFRKKTRKCNHASRVQFFVTSTDPGSKIIFDKIPKLKHKKLRFFGIFVKST